MTAPKREPGFGRKFLIQALIVFVSVLFLTPLLWMISSSLKPDYQVFEMPPYLIPQTIRWQNYPDALNYVNFGRFTVNSLVIAGITIIGHIMSCTVIAYGFARLRAPGKNTLFVVVLATMMLPYPVTMIPLFILFYALGWYNTILPLTVPAFMGSPFYIFLLRQFFMTLPPDLEDAARIDGANTLQIVRRIILPMSLPALATVAIFSFQASWNDLLGPLLYLPDVSKYTVTLGLSFFRSSMDIKPSFLMAAALVTMLPMVILFIFAQKLFVEGISLSGMHG